MEIIDNSKNELEYHLSNPIIYLADFYFKETLNSKKIKKTTKTHILKEKLFCNNKEEGTKNYYIKKFRIELGIKDDSEFEIEKVVLTKKINYSNII